MQFTSMIRIRRTAAGLGILALLVVADAPAASAGVPQLRLKGINGEVADKGHKGQIELLSYHPVAKRVSPK